jgi:hypothetical protein
MDTGLTAKQMATKIRDASAKAVRIKEMRALMGIVTDVIDELEAEHGECLRVHRRQVIKRIGGLAAVLGQHGQPPCRQPGCGSSMALRGLPWRRSAQRLRRRSAPCAWPPRSCACSISRACARLLLGDRHAFLISSQLF